jgi:hypothetical protein
MRTVQEFLERVKEYGFLRYEQSHETIGNAETCDHQVYLFLHNNIRSIVVFEECGEETPQSVIIICQTYEERKLIRSIAEGTDPDEEDDTDD